mmetsp:Transcript_79747/g.191348  ORF Transcript_79747/g.191348 Transcript_79747/m.191348 type:complete len:220 (-) Transcript_79747:34-693(-)
MRLSSALGSFNTSLKSSTSPLRAMWCSTVRPFWRHRPLMPPIFFCCMSLARRFTRLHLTRHSHSTFRKGCSRPAHICLPSISSWNSRNGQPTLPQVKRRISVTLRSFGTRTLTCLSLLSVALELCRLAQIRPSGGFSLFSLFFGEVTSPLPVTPSTATATLAAASESAASASAASAALVSVASAASTASSALSAAVSAASASALGFSSASASDSLILHR